MIFVSIQHQQPQECSTRVELLAGTATATGRIEELDKPGAQVAAATTKPPW